MPYVSRFYLDNNSLQGLIESGAYERFKAAAAAQGIELATTNTVLGELGRGEPSEAVKRFLSNADQELTTIVDQTAGIGPSKNAGERGLINEVANDIAAGKRATLITQDASAIMNAVRGPDGVLVPVKSIGYLPNFGPGNGKGTTSGQRGPVDNALTEVFGDDPVGNAETGDLLRAYSAENTRAINLGTKFDDATSLGLDGYARVDPVDASISTGTAKTGEILPEGAISRSAADALQPDAATARDSAISNYRAAVDSIRSDQASFDARDFMTAAAKTELSLAGEVFRAAGLAAFAGDFWETEYDIGNKVAAGDKAGALADVAAFAARWSGALIGEALGFSIAGPIGALVGGAFGYWLLSGIQPQKIKLPFLLGKPGFSDPLVLDLAGLGIVTTGVVGSPTYFDYTGTGARIETGWIGSGQGLLVFAPGDGATVTTTDLIGALSGSGFADLTAHDTNGDGVIDPSDAVFAQLRVWVDSDANGESGAGELFTLNQLGITAISVRAEESYTDSNGNAIVAFASYSKADGSGAKVYEVNFQTNPQSTVLSGAPTDISKDAELLPDLDGFGLLPDLRMAMTMDSTLLQMVRNLVSISSSASGEQYDSLFKDILFRWAGVQGFTPDANGPNVDAREAGFVDAYFGENPEDVLNADTQPNGHNGPTVWAPAFQQLLDSYKTRFTSQIARSLVALGGDFASVAASPYLSASLLYYDSGSNQFDGGFQTAFLAAQALAPKDTAAAAHYWDQIIPILQGLRWDVTNTSNPITGSPLAQLAVDARLAGFSSALISQLMKVPNVTDTLNGYTYSSTLSSVASVDNTWSVSTSTYTTSAGSLDSIPTVFGSLSGSIYEPFVVYSAYYDYYNNLRFTVAAGLYGLGDEPAAVASGDTASADSSLSLYTPVGASYGSIGSSSSGQLFLAPTLSDVVTAGSQDSPVGVSGFYATRGEAAVAPFAYGVYSFAAGAGKNYILAGTLGDLVLPGTYSAQSIRFEGFNGTRNLKLFFIGDDGLPTNDSVVIEDALGAAGRTIDKILLADGTDIFPGGGFVSTWFGSAASPSLVGFNSSSNKFEIGLGTRAIKLGQAGGDTLDYQSGDGAVLVDVNGSGTANLRLGADVTASEVLFESDTNSGNLTVLTTDAQGNLTGDSVTLLNALTMVFYHAQHDALQTVDLADGTALSNLTNVTSTWIGSATKRNLVGSDWGANVFRLGAGGDTVSWGSGSAAFDTSNYNLVQYGLGDGAVTITVNGGVGDIQFSAGVTASNLIYESDTATGNLRLIITDAAGKPTDDSITILGALSMVYYHKQNDALQNVRFPDGTVRSDLVNITSTWVGSATDKTLVGSDWGANTFVLGTGGDTVSWGNGSCAFNTSNYNLVEYGLGDGAVTIDPNGGVGDIQFGAGITASNLLFESDTATGNLTLLITDGAGNLTGDSILLTGILGQQGYHEPYDALQNIRFSDGTSLSNLVNLTSTWLRSTGGGTLVGSDWGPNIFRLDSNGGAVVWGNGSSAFDLSNHNLVQYGTGQGFVTVSPNGGIGDVEFAAGISASNLLFQSDTATGNLTILIADAAGTPTGGGLLLLGALGQQGYHQPWDALQNIVFADGTTISNLVNLTSTWIGSSTDTDLVGSDWGANTFVLGQGGDTVAWGNGSGALNLSSYNLVEYGLGDGAVTVNTNGAYGDIEFGAGITAANLLFQSDSASGSVTVLITGADGRPTDDSIEVVGAMSEQFYHRQYDALQSIHFADRSSLDLTSVPNTWFGTSTNTNLVGSSWGTNTFVLGQGGDTVTWGNGNDALNVSNRYNLVEYSLGDGAVTVNTNGAYGDIQFGAGITASNLLFESDSATGSVKLLITGADGRPTGDSIQVLGAMSEQFYHRQYDALQSIHFADGSSLDLTSVPNTWFGTPTNTNLVGSSWGTNTFVLGAGGDTVSWGSGNDALNVGGNNYNLIVYGLGDGAATVYVNGGYGDIQFGAGVNASNVAFQSDSASGSVTVLITGTDGRPTGDSIQVVGAMSEQFYHRQYDALRSIHFADGTSLDLTSVPNTWFGTPTNTNLVGSSWGTNTFVLGQGGDTVTWGNGNDALNVGGNNYNLVRYGAGDGSVSINTNGAYGDLQFDASVDEADVEVQEKGSELILTDRRIAMSITVSNDFWSDNVLHSRVGTIGFADGTVWSSADFEAKAQLVALDSGSTVWGTDGNDTLVGGPGNDGMIGGSGDDTYVYDRGGGTDSVSDFNGYSNGGFDTLQLGPGLSPADIDVERIDNSAVLKVRGTNDSVLIYNEFDGDQRAYVERVTFTDGTIWTGGQLLIASSATNGDDHLVGTDAADTLRGRDGDDLIEGGSGDDLLFGDDGNDRILGGDGNDTLVGGSDLTSGNAAVGASPADYVAVGPNVIVNGSFEDLGDPSNDYQHDWGVETQDMAGWTKINGQAFEANNSGVFGIAATDGNFWLDMTAVAGSDAYMDISQTVSGLDKTGTYLLQFDVARPAAAGDAQIEVLWDGQVVSSISSFSGSMQTVSLLIKPTDASGTLTLKTTGGPNYYGVSLDNVRMQEADLKTSHVDDDTLIGGLGSDHLLGGDGNDLLYGDDQADDVDQGGTYVTTGQNLLVNGSFEELGPNPDYQPWGVWSDELPGWTKANPGRFNQVNSGNDGALATEGHYLLDLDDAGEPGSNMNISQTVSGLSEGEQLLLQVDHANPTGWNSGFFDVYWNDQLVGEVTDTSSTMSTLTLNLTAAEGDNTLRFVGLGAEDGVGGQIDNVRLTAATFMPANNDDVLDGGSGDDILNGGAGNDTLIGGDGLDTAVYRGNRDDYQLSTANGVLTITDLRPDLDGNDGTDTLTGIEKLQFKDTTVDVAAPIVLDLDGNGIELTPQAASQARFDMNGDGVADATSWIGKGDALLVLDRNGDGVISGIDEISFMHDKAGATSDLDGLSAFDTNGDGNLSAADADYSRFQVWRDANGDGVVGSGELASLEAAGIALIGLHGTDMYATSDWGVGAILHTGSFVWTDGIVGQFADAALTYLPGQASAETAQAQSAAAQLASASAAFGVQSGSDMDGTGYAPNIAKNPDLLVGGSARSGMGLSLAA